jgi:hypothetical protein
MLTSSCLAQILPMNTNQTLQMVLSQSFFTNLTYDFIAPLLNDITKLKLPSLVNQTLGLDNLDVHFNVSNIHFTEFSIDPYTPIIRLQENKAAFEISNLDIDLVFDYEFVTKPPILGDIGEMQIEVRGVNLVTTFASYLTDQK